MRISLDFILSNKENISNSYNLHSSEEEYLNFA